MKKGAVLVLAAGVMLACLTLRGGDGQALPVGAEAALPEQRYFVALTFDDGPRRSTTPRLLDGLRQRGASATFFLVGEEAAAAPELVRRMQQEGHQVGNHTWSHVRLEDVLKDTALREVEKTDALLQTLLGQGEYWLRPPYGQISAEVEQAVRTPLVTWSVDPRDWESRNTEKVIQAVLEQVKPGSIILLHDIYPTSVDAALSLVDTLEGRGYCFVTVEELLRLSGVEAEAGKRYRSAESG